MQAFSILSQALSGVCISLLDDRCQVIFVGISKADVCSPTEDAKCLDGARKNKGFTRLQENNIDLSAVKIITRQGRQGVCFFIHSDGKAPTEW